METASGMTVYTQDDIDNAVANATIRTKEGTINSVCNDVKDIFKDEVRESNMARDYATALYNTIAQKVGGMEVTTIGATYTVEIVYDGETIMTLNGIEADDEDEATDTVSNEISVDDVELRFTISHDGNYETVESPFDSWDIITALEYNAIEE